MEDAERMQVLLVDRADALDALEVVGRAGARGGQSRGPLADGVRLLLGGRVRGQFRERGLDVGLLGLRVRMRGRVVGRDGPRVARRGGGRRLRQPTARPQPS